MKLKKVLYLTWVVDESPKAYFQPSIRQVSADARQVSAEHTAGVSRAYGRFLYLPNTQTRLVLLETACILFVNFLKYV